MPKVHSLIITFPRGHRLEGEIYSLMTIREDHLPVFEGRMAEILSDGVIRNHQLLIDNLGKWYPDVAAKIKKYIPVATVRLIEPGVMYDPHKKEVK